MKRTLLISVAALALATGSAFAQGGGGGAGGGGGVSGAGGGGNTPMANPSGPSGGGGGMNQDALPGGTKAPAKGAQERGTQDKKATQAPSTQDRKSTEQAPATRQSQDDKAAPATRQSQDGKSGQPSTTTQQQGQQPGTATQQQTQGTQPGGSKQGTSAQGGGTMTSKNVSLTTEQKTTIRQTVLTASAPRVTNVNFDIRVGVAVPRTVRVAPLPATIISIEPEWRGYMYFVYNDEIIIVEPRTLQIVAVLVV